MLSTAKKTHLAIPCLAPVQSLTLMPFFQLRAEQLALLRTFHFAARLDAPGTNRVAVLIASGTKNWYLSNNSGFQTSTSSQEVTMSHHSNRAFLFAPFLLIAACASALLAQSSRGTVTGLIQDASKAAISNAAVELANEQTKVVRSTNSNDAGTYRFDAVDPGLYSVKVTAPGFKVISIRNFEVAAGQVVAKDAQLELGQVTSTIEVSGAGAAIQTDAPVRGGTTSTQNIIELPIATQNPATLALPLPAVSPNGYP